MANVTAIEWTDLSWNPVHGCSKVSPGCAHCYAAEVSLRYGHTRLPWTPANAAENVLLKPKKLREPLSVGKDWLGQGAAAACAGVEGKLVFVNSTSDLFHEQVPDEFIDRVFAVMAWSERHAFQVLTKRPERMRAYLTAPGREDAIEAAMCSVCCSRGAGYGVCGFPGEDCGLIGTPDWPLPNVWLGVSIENRRFVDRADVLRETPAAVRFISAEPLLGPLVPCGSVATSTTGTPDGCWSAPTVEFRWRDGRHGSDPGLSLDGIDWLIVGGESGPRHRPIDPRWVIDLRDAATRAGTAFFFKQWGGRTPKAGGRELDGRTWDEFPQIERTVTA